jgi:hypothetical protein
MLCSGQLAVCRQLLSALVCTAHLPTSTLPRPTFRLHASISDFPPPPFHVQHFRRAALAAFALGAAFCRSHTPRRKFMVTMVLFSASTPGA